MSEYYKKIGSPLKFGKIVVQHVSFPRHVHRQRPRGEPYYTKKLGYVIVSWSELTPIKDVYDFLSWQLEFERKVRFLDEDGNIVDEKPNSLWKEKHLQPLIETLEKIENLEEPLSPTLEEIVQARAQWIPTYPEITHFLNKRIIKNPELMSAKEFKAVLRNLEKLVKTCEPPDTSKTPS